MLYPDAQPQGKSGRSGTPAKPKKRPRANRHVAVPGDFLSPAPATPPKPAPTPQPVKKAPDRGKLKYTLAEQIRRRNQERARQDAAAQKRRPSIPTVIYTAFDKHRADEHQERIKERQTASSAPSPSGFPQDISQDERLDSQSLPDLQSFYAEPDWPAGRPLTEGQKYHVDHLLSIEDDTLARSMLIGIRRDGMPSPKYLNDYLARFAEWGWDEISDERTLELLNTIRQSNWDAWLERADSAPVETAAQDLANNTIESLQVIDAATGQVLLSRVGVLGANGGQSVGLQAEEIQTFQGRELIFVHNHPNGAAASDADLRTAFLAGAELLLVVTPRGYEYAYIRGENGMALVREGDASYEVGPGTAEEYVELTGRSWRQAQANKLNPPEYLMLQDEPNRFEVGVDTSYIPAGMTATHASQLFKVDFDEENYQRILSDWKDIWEADPRDWAGHGDIEALMSTIKEAADQWNHPESGMSNDAVAALLIANLHQESHYRRANPSVNDFGNQLGSVLDSLGYLSAAVFGNNASLGPANLRPSVVDEMLGAPGKSPSIPMPYENSLPFDDEGRLDDLEEKWSGLDRKGRADFLFVDKNAIRLMGANFRRGVERLQDQRLQPTMFNMSAWLSQGIAESSVLGTNDGNAPAARSHASQTVRFVTAIIANKGFGLTIDSNDFILFNDDDILAYLMFEKGE